VIIGNLDISFKAVNQKMASEEAGREKMVELKFNGAPFLISLAHFEKLIAEAQHEALKANRGEGEKRD
jgi:hypothetical protein